MSYCPNCKKDVKLRVIGELAKQKDGTALDAWTNYCAECGKFLDGGAKTYPSMREAVKSKS